MLFNMIAYETSQNRLHDYAFSLFALTNTHSTKKNIISQQKLPPVICHPQSQISHKKTNSKWYILFKIITYYMHIKALVME